VIEPARLYGSLRETSCHRLVSGRGRRGAI